MAEATTDISIFKGHSIRGQNVLLLQVLVSQLRIYVLDAAEWSSEGTFQCYYCREL